ncbi:TonB-dependent receptor [Olivibacter ginsenosidimutans]|uniref:TonB-dependent receptor n=1 Tax=Olivibacter ginsenosidimutans TaxID=1176537 RepID=A0ABP9BL00_9SPHI
MKLYLLSFFALASFVPITVLKAQEPKTDTLYQLSPADVQAYLGTQPYLSLPSSVGLLDQNSLTLQQGNTLLPSLNTIPGVRMEERSPGSYRLSIRGSLLRSPFGVRNVKIYIDDIPLTDAAGNTYLNSIDPLAFEQITILKGPDGSLFGANSGGVVLMSPKGIRDQKTPGLALDLSAGSYGLFNQHVSGNFQPSDTYRFSLDYAHQQSDGYRENTASHRHYIQTVQRYNYSAHNEIRLVGFYSTMGYQTPGGLTESQYAENPKQARPAAGPNPGAVEQKAAIYNNTLWGGLVHEAKIGSHVKHVVSVFGTYTDFTNPFLTNYEKRYEHNLGFRSYLTYTQNNHENFKWNINAGIEWQNSKADILNFDNNQGNKGGEQTGDRLKNQQHFYFLRFSGKLEDRLMLETALSLNYYHYAYQNLFPNASDHFERIAPAPTWMPRAALSYLITPNFSWRISTGKGFSPPTSEEVRPSDQMINTNLHAETGWNHETGFRWQNANNRFQADASIFSYRMQDAIVRRIAEDGAESFTNAGGVKQRGLEAALGAWIIQPNEPLFIKGLRLSTNITWSHFRFDDYTDAESNYSGNKLTGVPGEVVVSALHVLFPKKLSVYLQHNYTSSIPLNDANTTFARSYHLFQGKVMWEKNISHTTVRLSGGIDNILNKKYSLGNDINAFGGRFFNAAMPRNYYLGLNVLI